MSFLFAPALALAFAQSTPTGGAPLATDLSYAMPVSGSWRYVPASDGSEADFDDSSGHAQLVIRCTRSTRQVSILKPASSPSPTLWVWTSSQIKSLPAAYDLSSARVSAELPAFDPLLDAIASSRGRIGFSTSGLAALVVPPWAEAARVIEDCRL